MNNRLIKSNDAGGGGACTNTVDLYNPFPDGGGVALYQLNGDATDSSPNAYNGTWSGAEAYGTGVFGQAGVFNGSTSKITLTASATTPIDLSTDNFTISFWVKGTTNASYGALISKYGSSNPNRSLYSYRNTNGTIVYGLISTTDVFNAVTSNGVNPINQWTHVVFVRNSTTQSIYLDGAFDNSISNTTTTKAIAQPLLVGDTDDLVTDEFFEGSIDQLRFFNRALRPYEVEALYTEEYCTPTIVPSEHFNTVTYTGNGSTQSITGVGFQPDFVWIKDRNAPSNHQLQDSVRGTNGVNGYLSLATDATYGESTFDAGFKTTYGSLTNLNADGFTVVAGSDATNTYFNNSSRIYAAWNFKAAGYANTFNVLENGSTTSSATAAGAGITEGSSTNGWSVSANRDAGFSIVSYTGQGTNVSLGHGLNATPKIIFSKPRNATGAWFISINFNGNQYYQLPSTSGGTNWAGDSRTDTTFNTTIPNGTTNIMYCFAEVEGFSNFGSYVGTETSQGIVTGFEPAFVIIKCSSVGGTSWLMFDNKRVGTNKPYLLADSSAAEDERASNDIRFLNNGFELLGGGGGINNGSDSYIYMAFAADPTAVEPTLEDSFNTVVYSGNNSTNAITGVGFQPDLVWIKERTDTSSHAILDSVRGIPKVLASDFASGEDDSLATRFTSFDSDGFTLGNNNRTNQSGTDNYVSWNWKGAEIPAINSNGSIPSVVSANPAAGFSIVSYTGNGSNATIGHGLNTAPSVYIVKNRDAAIDWAFETTLIDGSLDYLFLNSTAAKGDAVETVPNETIFNIDGSVYLGANNNKFIAYCFAEVAGFSKFGSYTGTGAAGNFQDCGFEPAFVMVKRYDGTGNWFLLDNKRDTTDPRNNPLYPNLSNAEGSLGTGLNFLSTGFSFSGGSINTSGENWIFMAFANQF